MRSAGQHLILSHPRLAQFEIDDVTLVFETVVDVYKRFAELVEDDDGSRRSDKLDEFFDDGRRVVSRAENQSVHVFAANQIFGENEAIGAHLTPRFLEWIVVTTELFLRRFGRIDVFLEVFAGGVSIRVGHD